MPYLLYTSFSPLSLFSRSHYPRELVTTNKIQGIGNSIRCRFANFFVWHWNLLLIVVLCCGHLSIIVSRVRIYQICAFVNKQNLFYHFLFFFQLLSSTVPFSKSISPPSNTKGPSLTTLYVKPTSFVPLTISPDPPSNRVILASSCAKIIGAYFQYM